MRIQLFTVAATFSAIAFASTAAAIQTQGGSPGGAASGGYSAPSGGGSAGGSSSSSGGGSSSSSGSGSASGAAHSGGGGGSAHAGAGGGGAFAGRAGFNGYGNFAAPASRDLAHGGYRVVGVRPASVVAGTPSQVRSSHSNALEVGPRLGSAATAVRVVEDKRPGMGPPHHPTHPHHPHRQLPNETYALYTACLQNVQCNPPREMCFSWLEPNGRGGTDMVSPLDCPQPEKLPVRLKQ